MTRRSRRELARAVAELDGDDGGGAPEKCVRRRVVVDGDGTVIDTEVTEFDLDV